MLENTKLTSFTLYETSSMYYLVGCDSSRRNFSIVKIDRSTPSTPEIFTDPSQYNENQMNTLLHNIQAGKGKFISILAFIGVLGFIRFSRGYYMHLITKKKQIALIGSNKIFKIEETALVPIEKSNSSFSLFKDNETKYREMYLSFDCATDFYFSYTYDLTNTLQTNLANRSTRAEQKFMWNSFLIDQALNCGLRSNWLVTITHGSIGQRVLNINGREIYLILIARRSRFYAGTRYLKRGINDDGNVANFVETEQILYNMDSLSKERQRGSFTSFVQNRGSIPLFWSQTISTKVVNPKPDIVLGKFEDSYDSTKLHFNRLFSRYGPDIICLDLIKRNERHPREALLGIPYRRCIDFLNFELKDESIELIQWDLKEKSKNQVEFLHEFNLLSEKLLKRLSFFSITKNSKQLQVGVLRTNCIDCLDRTNVAQSIVGKFIFSHQLLALGVIQDISEIMLDAKENVLDPLYEELGNRIAHQYGGSNMVSAGIKDKSMLGDMLNSFTRYYKNNFSDETKQHVMNLFLGNFVPDKEKIHLWDLESDMFLHLGDEEQIMNIRNSFRTIPSPLSSVKMKRSNKELTKDNAKLKKEEFFDAVYQTNKMTSLEDLLKEDKVETHVFCTVVTPKPIPVLPFVSPKTVDHRVDKPDMKLYEKYFEPIHPGSFISHRDEFEYLLSYENHYSATFNLESLPRKEVVKEMENIMCLEEKKYESSDPYVKMMDDFFPRYDDMTLISFVLEMKANINVRDRIKQTADTNGSIQEQLIRSCFVGQDAISWIQKQKYTFPMETRKMALDLLNLLMVGQVIHHIDFRPSFDDDSQFYRFYSDDVDQVLNIHQVYVKTETMDPIILSTTVMQKISKIYHLRIMRMSTSSPSQLKFQFNRTLEPTLLKKIYESSDYQEFLGLILQLQKIDLFLCSTRDKMLFYINIFNTLFLHGCLELYSGDLSHSKGDFYHNTCYRIGQFNISLFDIKHGILRGNKKGYGCLMNPFDQRKNHLCICVDVRDPRVLFVLCQSNSPVLKGFDSLECIDEASRQYFLDHIRTRNNSIILPKLLLHYQEDFPDILKTIKQSLNEKDVLYKRIHTNLIIEYK